MRLFIIAELIALLLIFANYKFHQPKYEIGDKVCFIGKQMEVRFYSYDEDHDSYVYKVKYKNGNEETIAYLFEKEINKCK